MTLSLRTMMKRFRKDQAGSLSVEAVIILPLLFWAICATFTYYNAFKVQNAVNRANYTLGDIVSRETGTVTPEYVQGLHNLYQYMTRAKDENTWIRVSTVTCKKRCNKANRVLRIDWSYGTAGAHTLKNTEIRQVEEMVPLLPKGDTLILVETNSVFVPLFKGMVPTFGDKTMASYSVTRPRFAQQVVWSEN